MATRTDYETTTPPASMNVGTGLNATYLGKRNDAGLIDAFDTPSGAAGAPRNTLDGQRELLRVAKEKMEAYNGENAMFPQYRRSFEPQAVAGGSLDPEYVAVRDKSTVTVGVGTGLGTPYSPTIASPGEAAGINPANLAVVSSSINGAVPEPFDNPSVEVHQNVDSLGRVDGVAPNEKVTGKVRRFTLGVGSGGSGTPTEQRARGQFPRPLT